MNDILVDLRAALSAYKISWGSVDNIDVLMERAIAEIERLRSVSGAVSAGETFAEMRAQGNFRAHAAPGIVRDVDG